MKSLNYDINISNHTTQMFAFILEKAHRTISCLDKLRKSTSLKMNPNLPGTVKIYFLKYITQELNIRRLFEK